MKFLYFVLATTLLFSCKERSTTTTTPADYDDDAKGCRNFDLYKIIEQDKVLSISIDNKLTTFSTEMQVYENIAEEAFATVSIEQNQDLDALWNNTCNGVFLSPSQPSTNWTLRSGKLSYKVSKVLAEYGCSETYDVTLILENAVFEDGNGNQMTLPYTNFDLVKVGLCTK
jgi:hypothetical protein